MRKENQTEETKRESSWPKLMDLLVIEMKKLEETGPKAESQRTQKTKSRSLQENKTGC